MAELNTLIAQRANLKGRMTRIHNFAKQIDDDTDIGELRVRVTELEQLFDRYNTLQEQIESVDAALDKQPVHEMERQQVEDKYYSMKSLLESFFSNGDTKPTVSNETTQIKLPQVNIPTFSGKIKDWPNFKSLFYSIIHNNCSISTLQKFHYLKSLLSEEPAGLINALLLNEGNYINALNLLEKRYENKLIIVNHHLKTILKGTPVTKVNLKEFLIEFQQSIDSLKSIDIPIESWDLILIYIIVQKLDISLNSAWVLNRQTTELPTLQQLLDFLNHRCVAQELINDSPSSSKPFQSKTLNKVTHFTTQFKSSPQSQCILCNKGSHELYKCPSYLEMTIEKRNDFVRANKLCYNCLTVYKLNHRCSKSKCRICQRRHHSTLHNTSYLHANNQSFTPLAYTNNTPQTTTYNNHNSHNGNSPPPAVLAINNKVTQVLLSTALVKIKNNTGTWYTARALLDSGSEINLITRKLAQQMNSTLLQNHVKIQGIGNTIHDTHASTSVNIGSRFNNKQYTINCAVTERITASLPHCNIDTTQWDIPTNYHLADPSFHIPGEIDLLIGAQLFYEFIRRGCIRLGSDLPLLSNTVFGWIVSGPIKENSVDSVDTKLNFHSASLFLSHDDELTRFWEQEELTCKTITSSEDKYCEDLYINTTTRTETGRYTVDLPLKDNTLHLLGNSFNTAFKCFKSLESKFNKNSILHSDYKKFIHEYIELGHANYVTFDNLEQKENIYYLPHHSVIRPENISTKLRVVFNGSAKTSTGFSLNDIMYEGPNILPQLVDIIIRFRTYPYVFTADIVKMFRQINVNPTHRPLQCILWRDTQSEPIKALQLNTVTYGTNSAPYLAFRTLLQLAKDDGHLYPLASQCIQTQFYMDDVLTGGYTIEETINIRNQLKQLLSRAGFTLHKWAANHRDILCNTHDTNMSNSLQTNNNFEINSEINIIKTLGLQWDPSKDKFKICVQQNDLTSYTKRTILSSIARIFDPIGYLAPAIITAKLFIQTLWKEKVEWDQPLSKHLVQTWKSFYDNLYHLKYIDIPRYCFNTPHPDSIDIIGFCDASNLAYGACIYIRALHSDNISCNLIISKSRLAPIKTITIPRLELNGALLLSRLIHKVKDILKLNICINNTYLFTDSTIVLHWLKTPHKRWNIYVSNRLTEILEYTTYAQWSHVNTKENPADLITRGINPALLKDTLLWWHGPSWTMQAASSWPVSKIPDLKQEQLNCERHSKVVTTTRNVDENYFITIFNNVSNFLRLKRIIAYCYRFITNSRSKGAKLTHPLTVHELSNSHDFIIKCIQEMEFSIEINELKSTNMKNQSFTLKSSPLKKLVPFLDSKNILRIGGRIKHANIQYDQKHPIILPANHHITHLIIQQYHINLFHSGIQNVLANIRLKYWPINGRNAVKRVIHSCITCTRFRGKASQQLMADLPGDRVNLQRPFLHVGLDFGGPIYVKSSKLRNSKLTKGYICLFVCLSTKAIHLEMVSDLTTMGFISALKRFIARRGHCSSIYSDNATNFRGAHNELNELHLMFYNQQKNHDIIDFTANLNIKWHFTVPVASHMGGIYEAGIKSAKNLIKKKLGNMRQTFEDLNTILVQIEAILNSRPLCAVTDLPDDLTCLTPAHFLIGQSLVDLPEPDLQHLPEGKLTLHKKITLIKQQFWRQWHLQYLSELQVRTKWHNIHDNLSIGTLVIIKEDAVPPLHWILGRITQVFINQKDGLVRSAKVKTAKGEFHRPIHKLVKLPVPVQ